MISAATLPMPETGPSINRNWIKANAVAAAIYAAIGVLTFATDKLLGVNGTATAMSSRGIAAVIALAGTIVPIVAYAMLTGAVLSDKLPRFSKRGWIAMHGSIGAVLGTIFAIVTLFGPVANNATPPTPSLSVLIVGLSVAGVMAAMFGALMGGLQALVLRKAATGTGTWIVLSAMVTPLTLLALAVVAFGLGQNSTGFGGALAMQTTMFAAMVGAAVMMLPALNRLTPRQ